MQTSKLPIAGHFPIIALTGSFGSGSTRIAEILAQKYGYYHVKVSEFLKQESKRRGIKIEDLPLKQRRKTLQDMGNKLREENGWGYLVRRLMEKIVKEKIKKPIVFESIKNRGEIFELREYPNSYILAVNASSDTRWKRVRDDRYDGDFNQFKEDDERDKDEGIKWGQDVQKCVDLADIYIINEKNRPPGAKSDWEWFESKLYSYIKVIEEPGCRNPTTPELLMNNAYHTSLSSNCLKRQVGATIAIAGPIEKKEKVKIPEAKEYLIASGYNAVPEKQECCEVKFGECYRDKKRKEFLKKIKFCPNCTAKLDSGVFYKCPKCETDFIKEYRGKALDLCRALHAEESAILQSSRLGGISLVGATLYTTTFPCLLCAKKIIAVGIKRVVWLEPYPYKEAREMLKNAEIEMTEFEGVKAQSFYKLFSKVT